MENEQVNPEGLEAGPEAPEADNPAGGISSPDLPGPTLEDRFAEILWEHDNAIKGMSAALMALAGRVGDVETFLLSVSEEKPNE